jgi:hypothetical protein
MIRHIVLFKFKAETTPEQRASFVSGLRGLPARIDILRHVEVGENITDSPRAFDISLMVDVDNEADLKAYAAHPDHQPIIKMAGEFCEISKLVDYVMG